MIEPTLALQTSIRAALIAAPAVIALVPADSIRAGSTRPDNLPSIIMANGQTVFLGYGAKSLYIARVSLDLHVWAIEDGADTAQSIGFAMCNALREPPVTDGYTFDDFSKPAMRWMRDPEPEKSFTHGAGTVEAVIRWQF